METSEPIHIVGYCYIGILGNTGPIATDGAANLSQACSLIDVDLRLTIWNCFIFLIRVYSYQADANTNISKQEKFHCPIYRPM